MDVKTLSQALSRVGPAVFEAIARGCREAAIAEAATIDASHAAAVSDLERKRGEHLKSLKPSLRNPANRKELLALKAAEAERSSAALAEAGKQRDERLASARRHAEKLLRRVSHTAAVLLALLDGVVQPEDLAAAGDDDDAASPSQQREAPAPGIFKQLRHEARQAAALACTDPRAAQAIPLTGGSRKPNPTHAPAPKARPHIRIPHQYARQYCAFS